jgi:endonuclease/exonuclease/phosphatase (EEP) superfamily protein YafD
MHAHQQKSFSHFGTTRSRLTLIAVIALTYSVVTLIVRTLPLPNELALVVAVGSPYTSVVALLGLALSTLSRRRLLSTVAVCILATTAAVQVQWYYFGQPAKSGQHVDIRVLSSNLRKGQADAVAFVGLAETSADVITVSELTPEEAQRFSQAGIDNEFPHSLLIPAPDAAGIGLWSRFPIIAVPLAKPWHTGVAAARLRIPGMRLDPLVASVHITSPVTHDENSFTKWRSDIAATKVEMKYWAKTVKPAAVIVAGDFNSTPDMRQFRDLLTDGYRDAVEQVGAGFAPTFPSNLWFPPFIAIDHVLTRSAGAASIKTVMMPGSDHRALLANVRVPMDPPTP